MIKTVLCISIFFIGIISLFALDSIPGISGMTKINDNSFLIVRDLKNPIQKGNRLGIVTILKNRINYQPVEVNNWKDKEGTPSDLEAVCGISGTKNEYLVAESGYYKHKFGRVFRIKLFKNDKEWKAEVLNVLRIYEVTLDRKGSTPSAYQNEGMGCISFNKKTVLIYTTRGKAEKGKLASIIWGEVNFNNNTFKKMGESTLVVKTLLGDRDCSDLYIVKESDTAYKLWAVSTVDSGDLGPFVSEIYSPGKIIIQMGTVQFIPNSEYDNGLLINGLKIEALAAPADLIPKSKFSIGTDDEIYGGVWRPIGLAKKIKLSS
ncbi:MAG TPA: hypothetical protein QF753_02685 [Victivallales bacterium]|nr:hypothetical protein [Victivallales bacterium]